MSLINRVERLLFKHVVDILTVSGVMIVLLVAALTWYDNSRSNSRVAESYRTLETVVQALQLYSFENPGTHVFPPAPNQSGDGVLLCPVEDNNVNGLNFLTTPVAFINTVPSDPFMSHTLGGKFSTPAVLHWVRFSRMNGTGEGYDHIGWGAMSVGPALMLPPQYNIEALRQVPFDPTLLQKNMYNPSNGVSSVGILYYDSLGNRSSL